jgi:hypothetical protein
MLKYQPFKYYDVWGLPDGAIESDALCDLNSLDHHILLHIKNKYGLVL